MGEDALDRSDFSEAQVHFDTAKNLAEASQLTPWSYLLRAKRLDEIGSQLKSKIEHLSRTVKAQELIGQAKEKYLPGGTQGAANRRKPTPYFGPATSFVSSFCWMKKAS